MEKNQILPDSLSGLLSRILDRYGEARRNEAFGGKHEISQLFERLRKQLERSAPVRSAQSMSVVSSYGKGNWATIPWVSILDARETSSTQRGVYLVYLFREDGQGVWVKLAQGVTDAQQEFKSKAIDVLRERAERVRPMVSGLAAQGFDLSGKSDLGTNHKMARMYEASTIAAKYYPRATMPAEAEILRDLDALVAAYDSVVVRSIAERGVIAESEKRLALVGTWSSIRADIDNVAEFIQTHGGWASPWTFRVKEGALARLKFPFTLYINGGGGQIVARARVVDLVRAPDAGGVESPWPEITEDAFKGTSRFDKGVHGGIKTWLRFESIELIPPFRAEELSAVEGLSVPTGILNQVSFGYVWEEPTPSPRVEEVTFGGGAVDPMDDIPSDFQWLLDQTLLKREELQAMISVLRGGSPQILLVGPPGTSKTWVAQRLAWHLAAGRKRFIRTVQFHPSYTYESFIEGIRPRASEAGVRFELTPGVVVDVVNSMRQAGHLNDPSKPYIIVIDEANRANLPRVLGELLFLFEYRNEAIALQHTKNFQLPTNLIFIGTMNTADRSIRSIDAALRRRFEVFELGPNPEAIRRFLAKVGIQDGGQVADGLEALDAQLTLDLDRHHTIGHSFFMTGDMSPERLREIWGRQVYPLIEEYFFDQPDLARAYTLERFWPTYVK